MTEGLSNQQRKKREGPFDWEMGKFTMRGARGLGSVFLLQEGLGET